ncbi:MAG: arsenic resistance protein [Pseudomonadota bacterium]
MSVQDPVLPKENVDDPAPFATAALFIGAIALGAVIGLLAPAAAETFSAGIDATLLTMIFLLFFELRLGAIFKAFGNFRFLVIAWSANFLIIPVIGLGIANLFLAREPLLFVGLMIYFLAPCTDWFLGFTRMAKGDTELGAALIPINIVTQILLFPVWLWLLAKDTGLIDFAAMPQILLQWFIVPLLAAQTLRFALERFVPRHGFDRVTSWTNRCIPFVLAALIVQIFATYSGMLALNLNMFALVAAAVCLFFIATVLVGEGLSRLGRLDYPKQALLSMTMTARNAPLMLALTAVAIPDQPLILAVLVSGMLVEIPLLTALKQLMLARIATKL